MPTTSPLRRLARPALPALALGLLALPASASASAATVASAEPCVRLVPGEPTLPITATGFTPNGFVRVTADGQPIGSGVADAAGNFSAPFFAPTPEGRRTEQTFQLAATDSAGVAAPAVPLRVTRLTVTLPRRARPTSRVRFRAHGFRNEEPVYLHVRRGGRTLRSVRLGPAQGPCGTVSRRMKYLPLARFSAGNYDYYFNQVRRFDRKAAPTVRLRVLIFRTARPRSSAASAAQR